MHSSKSTPEHFSLSKAPDIHICGTCNHNFNDLTQFIGHKDKCSGIVAIVTTTLESVDPDEPDEQELSNDFQSNLERIKSDHMESNQEHRRQTVLHSLPLTENTKSKTPTKTLPARHEQFDALDSEKLVNTLHHSRKQYHNIMADEDVAAILANQLSNEVISIPVKYLPGQDGPSAESEVLAYHHDNPPLALQEIVISQQGGEEDFVEETQLSGNDTEVANSDVLLSPKKRHECMERNCNFSTTYLKDLVRHNRTHTGERPYTCTLCQRSFSRNDKLQQHQRIHIGMKPHQCHLCDYKAFDGGSLKKHIRIHYNERPFKCQMCTYSSRDSSQLTVHLRRHTGDQPFVCNYDLCTSAFKTSSCLKRHMRRHTGEKPFHCAQCEYTCSIKSNLAVHIKINHETALKRPTCKKCDFIATNRVEARKHAKIHSAEVLQCGLCEFSSENPSTMRNHLKTHSGVKSVSCKFCPYTCWNLGNLKRHLKAKHSDFASGSQEDLKQQEMKSSEFKSHQCPCCNVAFVREDSWRSHVRQHAAGLKHTLSGSEFIVSEPAVVFSHEQDPVTTRLDAKGQQILDSSTLQSDTMYLFVQADGVADECIPASNTLVGDQVHFVTLPGERTATSDCASSPADSEILGRNQSGRVMHDLDGCGSESSAVLRVSSQEKTSVPTNNSVIKRF